MSFEIARSLENVDFAAVLQEVLEGRTLEIKAELRLGARDDEAGGEKVRVTVTRRDRSS